MHADVGEVRQAVVYGDDERRDVFQETDASLAALARRHSVVLVSRRDVKDEGGRLGVEASSVRDTFGLCEGERFASQPTGGFCSGMLVEPDLVLTAAHCTIFLPCAEYRAVRGYEMANESTPRELSTSDVAGCLGVATDSDPELDVAWVRLDRPLGDFGPLVPSSTPAGDGDPLILVGNPLGMPTKIDRGVVVTGAGSGDYLTAAVDNFIGGSGSAVFDAAGFPIGVATSGASDFVEGGTCRTVKRLELADGVEKVFLLERALEIPREALPGRKPARQGGEASCAVGPAPGASGFWAALVAVAALAKRRSQSLSLVRRARAASCEAGSAERRDSSSRR